MFDTMLGGFYVAEVAKQSIPGLWMADICCLQGLASILPGSEAAPFPPAGRHITGRNRANSPVNAPGTALSMATRTQSESLPQTATGLSRFGSFSFGSRAAFRESNENIRE